MSATQSFFVTFGLTSAKIAQAKQALSFEDSADSFETCGHRAHAGSARYQADRLWRLAFDHIGQDGEQWDGRRK